MAHRYNKDFTPHLKPELLLAPLSRKKPAIIGVNFTGDLGGDWVDLSQWVRVDDYTDKEYFTDDGDKLIAIPLVRTVFNTLRACQQHQFIFLTKNPAAWQKWQPFPENAWIGATVCNDKMLVRAVGLLGDVNAQHKWLSIEPLMERIHPIPPQFLKDAGIEWVVIGGWSGGGQSPDIEWIREIVEACHRAKIKVWLKENLGELPYPWFTKRRETPFE
jgi:hypothetical protein